MIRSILICTALALTLATKATADKEQEIPCGRYCSEIWAPKWTACDRVPQCEAYVEREARICIRKCEEKEGK